MNMKTCAIKGLRYETELKKQRLHQDPSYTHRQIDTQDLWAEQTRSSKIKQLLSCAAKENNRAGQG